MEPGIVAGEKRIDRMGKGEDELTTLGKGFVDEFHRLTHLADGQVVVDKDGGDQVEFRVHHGVELGDTPDGILDSEFFSRLLLAC